MTALSIILFLVLIGGLCYRKVSLTTSSFLLAAYTLVLGITGLWSYWLLLPLAIVLFPLIFAPTRISLFSAPGLKAFRKVMPSMSTTEKEAIDAGTTWWEGDLFRGNPDWQKLHNYPKPQLTAEEQAFIDGPVEEACRMANDFQISHELADLPPELWTYLKENRFFAMIIKKEYGGLEFSAYAQSQVLQKLSGVSGILAITVGVPNSLGPGELLQHYGTDEQKKHYLPGLARGEEIPCFALTSPEAGSDAGAIPDTGVVCMGEWQGEQVLGMRLNWNKRYITLAPIATVLGLAFKLYDPDHLLGDTESLGITCALIPTNTPGVEIGRRHFPLNIPFQNGPTRGQDIFVPIDYIIGGPKMAGQGWRMLVECLSVGRGITLPSNATGGLKSAAMGIGAYSYIRRQFKLPIGKMEGIEEPLARIAGNSYLMDAAATMITSGIMLGEKPAVLSAIVKYHCTHRGQRAIIDAMDIAGGKGICLGPSNFLARGYQGSPIAITVEGANILTRSMIIFGQGAIRCHPYVLAEIAAAESNDVKAFDKALFGHLGHVASNTLRSLWLGITKGRTSSTPVNDATRRYYQHINRLSANLALLSDVSMGVLGGSLKRRERISARLGDILSQIFLASATLKRYEDEGRQKEDFPLVQWAVEDSLYQAEQAMNDLLRNFPNRLVAGLMRVIVFPLGRSHTAPSDKLDHKLAQILQTPSATRSRIGRGQYLTPSEHNPHGLLEEALHDIIAAEPIHARLSRDAGKNLSFTRLDKLAEKALAEHKISQEEAEILKRAENSRLRSINVDEFEADAFAVPSSAKKPESQRQTKAA
ncbi:acyl-CoA dehydrogenase [Xenorhabdus nematophila]|uniref:Acyl-coenzyme A dehydrogenase n=1 Tax=Xenorhabdus nematophila (strain ATCC 19061 / DSM 3370 / CCUG 14189 / LMG 1036 / NCIMB 9965 / AN6) TaxID=406817 RepID=D3VK36_XENNA|nr:acyl-CoA dehydrogenase FadE [Xenorhabdus nematophila]CEE90417.1 acyl coenzyme A dehydrogenase [Xenorhabdus nematophila str. Anatoliense]CEF31066.1 acyl coenzyme A dehydrogenase [Xenorhabdus nematophila str. Websteri]AYA39258.1 acyl-CoA dehydrogenase [Xenorhabdus nematophila]MBA0017835.1 acyl-CoA dehydrogenase [Xenorhabdus nematophila]MCB4425029.1 acyl-CoA dehydrogenase [Xenorhabdus nematophila]